MNLSCLCLVLLSVLFPTWRQEQEQPRPDRVAELLAELGAQSPADLIETFGGPVDDQRMAAIEQLALVLRDRSYVEAEPLFREIARLAEERFGAQSEEALDAHRNHAGLLFLAGRPHEGAERLRALLQRVRAHYGERAIEVAIDLDALANATRAIGDYETAEACYEEALEIIAETQGPESSQAAAVHSNFAIFLNMAGRASAAEVHAQRSVDIASRLGGVNSFGAAQAIHMLAIVQMDGGNLAAAELNFRAALRVFEQHPERSTHRRGHVLRKLGSLLTRKGDLEGAEDCLRAALPILGQSFGERSHTMSWALHDLAVVLARRGDREAAIEIMREALEIAVVTEGQGHLEQASHASALATLLTESGQLEQAVELYREALALLEDEKTPGVYQVATAQAGLARALRLGGDAEAARAAGRVALELLRKRLGDHHLELVGPLHELALSNEALDEPELALGRALEALAVAEEQRTQLLGQELERARFAGSLGHDQLSRLVARLHLEAGDLHQAFAALEAGRGRALLELLARSERALLAGPEGQAFEALLVREERARSALKAAEAAADAAPERPEGAPEDDGVPRETELALARSGLRAASAEVHAVLRSVWPDARPASVAEARAALAEGELMLAYLWSAELVAVLVLPPAGRGELSAVVLASGEVAASELTGRVRDLAVSLSRDPRRRSDSFVALEGETLARDLARLLPPQLQGRVAAARRVIVLPDGPLHALPLEALWPDDSKPLELTYASSASVHANRVALARRAAPPGAAGSVRRLVAVGDPTFDPERSVRLAPLPGARAEVAYLAQLTADRSDALELLVGEQATLEALEQRLDGVSILHIATHGFHGTAADPYDAALALAGAGPAADLTLDHLVRRWRGRLEGSDLVVLSACDTHRGVPAGTSLVSLPWGFFYAGAPTVIATLWKVDERATALLMARFFESLLGHFEGTRTAGATRYEAGSALSKSAALLEARTWLRTASRRDVRAALRRLGLDLELDNLRSPADAAGTPGETVDAGALRPYADPYFWSSFVLIGSPD